MQLYCIRFFNIFLQIDFICRKSIHNVSPVFDFLRMVVE